MLLAQFLALIPVPAAANEWLRDRTHKISRDPERGCGSDARLLLLDQRLSSSIDRKDFGPVRAPLERRASGKLIARD